MNPEQHQASPSRSHNADAMVVVLFALAWMDFYELVLASDLSSIDIQNRVVDRRSRLRFAIAAFLRYFHLDISILKLESEFWNHKMVESDIDGYTARFHELARLVPHMGAVSMANRLTIDGIKDGLFKKKENARNKKRSNDQNMNRGRDDGNKRLRTRGNFALTVLKQGQGQRQYAGQHPKYFTGRASNERPRLTCFECGDPNHFKRNCPRMNRATTS
uniref:CCHC-type domain-containing protein n=1 Tax=Tanacetum cinerariifolium TaxID=118510 RepID=A0A6L2JMG4_TANCI|nr:hypothetical protein [Tanacetum cinerariifolium]